MTINLDEQKIRSDERERLATIDKILAGLDGVDTLRAAARNQEIGMDELRDGALRIMRANRPTAPAMNVPANGGRNGDGVATAAALHLFGLGDVLGRLEAKGKISPQAAEIGRKTADNGIGSFLKCAAQAKGQYDLMHLDGRELVTAAFSTNAIPIAIKEAVELAITDIYQNTNANFLAFCSEQPAANFLPQTAFSPNFGSQFREVGADGEIKYSKIDSNFAPQFRLKTEADMIVITRQDFISQPSIYGNVMRSLVCKCIASQSNEVYSKIIANSGSFFSTTNGNYMSGSTTPLCDDALAEAIRLMRMAKDKSGILLNYEPATLLVGPTNEQQARTMIASGYTARAATNDLASTGRWLPNQLQLVVSPELETLPGGSSTAWYLFSRKENAAVVFATLNGAISPTVEEFTPQQTPEVLGWTYRAFSDFCAVLVNPYSAVMSKGTS